MPQSVLVGFKEQFQSFIGSFDFSPPYAIHFPSLRASLRVRWWLLLFFVVVVVGRTSYWSSAWLQPWESETKQVDLLYLSRSCQRVLCVGQGWKLPTCFLSWRLHVMKLWVCLLGLGPTKTSPRYFKTGVHYSRELQSTRHACSLIRNRRCLRF